MIILETLCNFRVIEILRTIAFILLFIPFSVLSQFERYDFSSVDRKVKTIPFQRTDSLAAALAAIGTNDTERVRAIFKWISENIDYHIRAYKKPGLRDEIFYDEPDDSMLPLPSLNDRVAAKVLRRKVAVCDGYSRLFAALCNHAGIRSEVISGFARTNMNRSFRFGSNHIWNAVMIDSIWYLLDVTWARGYVSYSNYYVKNFNEHYFLTTPGDFIRDHYPEDISWSLLTEPPIYREFRQSPFRYSGYLKYNISSWIPSKGIINAAIGDTISFQIETDKEISNIFISGILLNDSSQFTQPVMISSKDGVLNFNYIITPHDKDWLYIYINEDLFLRYKLNLRNYSFASNFKSNEEYQ